MTRLTTADIKHIKRELLNYNKQLISKTGATLAQIAAHAVEVAETEIPRDAEKIAIIPLTCGQGIIGGFSQTVQSIVEFLGFETFVTNSPDAGGVAEAVEKGAKVLMMADDDRFIAVNLATARTADNGAATGKGYAAGLDLLVGGVKGKAVLIIGAGPVGTGAALGLARMGALISIYDINQACSEQLRQQLLSVAGYQAKVEVDLEAALLKHKIFFDACPAGAYMHNRHITPEVYIAAPGIPLGVSSDSWPEVQDRTLHDPLEIGVATMIFEVLKP